LVTYWGKSLIRYALHSHWLCFTESFPNNAVRIPLRRGVLDIALCDKVCQWLTTDRSLGFSDYSGFWPPRYNWNIVESGVKHQPLTQITLSILIDRQGILNAIILFTCIILEIRDIRSPITGLESTIMLVPYADLYFIISWQKTYFL
jgi:hypothetical protein